MLAPPRSSAPELGGLIRPLLRNLLVFCLGAYSAVYVSRFFSYPSPNDVVTGTSDQRGLTLSPSLTNLLNSRKIQPPVTEIDFSRMMFPREESQALVDLMKQEFMKRAGMVSYLEYGSGGSTSELTPFANIAVSVEHDISWCDRIRSRLKEASIKNVIQLCVPKEKHNSTHAKIGWDGDYVGFRRYLEAVKRPGLPQKYDFVLIDGRARVGAALQVLPLLHNDSVVVLHDAVRKYYDPVEVFYHVERKNLFSSTNDRNGFKVLRMRENIPHFPFEYEIQTFYQQHSRN